MKQFIGLLISSVALAAVAWFEQGCTAENHYGSNRTYGSPAVRADTYGSGANVSQYDWPHPYQTQSGQQYEPVIDKTTKGNTPEPRVVSDQFGSPEYNSQ